MSIKSFDEYFEGYKNYDDGGKLDQVIIADAKKVFETLKTPEAIEQFLKADYETQQEMVKGLDDGHSGASFACVCRNAYRYATYAQKYVKEDTPQENISEPKNTQITKVVEDTVASKSTTNKLANVRQKLASKLGANIKDVKIPNKVKKIKAFISQKLEKRGH